MVTKMRRSKTPINKLLKRASQAAAARKVKKIAAVVAVATDTRRDPDLDLDHASAANEADRRIAASAANDLGVGIANDHVVDRDGALDLDPDRAAAGDTEAAAEDTRDHDRRGDRGRRVEPDRPS